MSKLCNRKSGLVSVVISAYNYGHFITDALNALKHQTYKDIEVIVVDDFSTDDTQNIVMNWKKNNEKSFKYFTYLKLPRNCGAGWSLNIGFSISKGEFIVIHDADDVSHEKKIEKQVDFLREHEDTAMVGTGYWTFKNDISEAHNGSGWLKYSPESIERSYKTSLTHCVSYGTIMLRAAILDEIIGCYKAIPVGNDMFFVNNIVKQNFLVDNIKENLFYVRQHKDQMSKKISSNKLESVMERRKKINGRVSVIMPFNKESNNLIVALNSIAEQSYNNIEIILIDDCSDNNSKNIIKNWYTNYKMKNRNGSIREFIYFRLPSEAGYPWVYNIGSYISKGEYIAFHGSNGISFKERLEKQVNFLKNNCVYSLVGGNIVSNNSFIKYDDDIEYSYSVQYMPCVYFNTIMFRTEIINKTAGLKPSIQGGEDFEFIYRLLNSGYRIQNLKDILYKEN